MRSRTRKRGALKEIGKDGEGGSSDISDAREVEEGTGIPGMIVILLPPATGGPVRRWHGVRLR
jgi:hypothetical protein